MSFSTFVFLIGLEKVGTSWIFGKGGVLEKGGGVGPLLPTMEQYLVIRSQALA